MHALAMILAGGRGSRLSILSQKRAKPAVPFAGKYRIIDFVLSNCTNSGITTVGILTQYRPRSLNDHIRTGSPWDLDRLHGGVWLLQPYARSGEGMEVYSGTANAIQLNFDFIRHNKPDFVVVLGGDHIYKMNYDDMITFHQEKRADVTIATLKVSPDEASRFGIMETDKDSRIIGFEEKPPLPKSNLGSMGIYVFNTEVLSQVLRDDANDPRSSHDFGKDIIPKIMSTHKVYAYPFNGYWVDVGTVQAYWEAHMDLLADQPPLDLLDRNWIIHTRSEERPPVNIRTGAVVAHSLITDGCVIEGTVEYSVLSPGVNRPECLKPLPALLPDYRDSAESLAHKDLRLSFDGNRYCVPPRYVGRKLTVKADSSSVVIYDQHREIVRYARSWERGRTFGAERFEKELFAQMAAAERSAAQQRLVALLGPTTEDYLRRLADTDRSLIRQVRELLALIREYGPDPVAAALEKAHAARAFGADYIANILRQQQVRRDVQPPLRLKDPELNDLATDPLSLAQYDAFILRSRKESRDRTPSETESAQSDDGEPPTGSDDL